MHDENGRYNIMYYYRSIYFFSAGGGGGGGTCFKPSGRFGTVPSPTCSHGDAASKFLKVMFSGWVRS